jgi:hypothetical protein
MNDTPNLMTHERIMTGEEYVSYSDYLKLQCERDEAIQRRMETILQCELYAQERDEAREVARGLAVQEERVEEAQKELSSIHRWIERNHPDGFIDSMTFHQNLERVGDRWYDRLDIVERERDEAQRELEMWKFERDEALEHAARYRLEANKLIMMGVELREQNAKLRDLVEKAIDCVTCNSDLRRLRAELDQLKEGTK